MDGSNRRVSLFGIEKKNRKHPLAAL